MPVSYSEDEKRKLEGWELHASERVPENFHKITRGKRECYRLYSAVSIDEYLKGIVKRLVGDDIFEKDLKSVPWVISENPDVINAYFARPYDGSCEYFCLTRGMLNLLENEDQLAYVMGHELTHFFAYKKEQKHSNSHFEEAYSDWNAIQQIGKAGYSIEEPFNLRNRLNELHNIKNPTEEENKKIDLLEMILKVVDVHGSDKTRGQVNEVAAVIAKEKQAEQDQNVSNVEPTPLNREILDKTEYISYIDLLFREAKFDEKTIDEKNDFLVELCHDLDWNSDFMNRKKDMEKYLNLHTKELFDHKPTEETIKNGTAPAISLIQKIIEKTHYRVYPEDPDIDPINQLMQNALSVWHRGNFPETKFWRNMKDGINRFIDKAKKNDAKKAHCDFASRLDRCLDGLYKWNLPRWHQLNIGDKRPQEMVVENSLVDFRYFGGAEIRDLILNRAIYEKYDKFIIQKDGRIVASNVIYVDGKKSVSPTIDYEWENEEKFKEWQIVYAKENIHRKIALFLKEKKQLTDDYITGKTKPEDLKQAIKAVTWMINNLSPVFEHSIDLDRRSLTQNAGVIYNKVQDLNDPKIPAEKLSENYKQALDFLEKRLNSEEEQNIIENEERIRKKYGLELSAKIKEKYAIENDQDFKDKTDLSKIINEFKEKDATAENFSALCTRLHDMYILRLAQANSLDRMENDARFKMLFGELSVSPLPDSEYVPKLWNNKVIDPAYILEDIKFDRDLLVRLMEEEGMDVSFWSTYQKEYLDELPKFYLDDVKTPLDFFTPSDYMPYHQEIIIAKYLEKFPEEEFTEENVKKWMKVADNSHWRYAGNVKEAENHILEELTKSYANIITFYLEKNRYNNLDEYIFSDYKTPIPEYIRKHYGLPEFLPENESAYRQFIQKQEFLKENGTSAHGSRPIPSKEIPGHLTYVIFDAVMRNNENRFSLNLIRDLMFKPKSDSMRIPSNLFYHFSKKVKKMCLKEELWPQNLIDFSDAVCCFNKKYLIDKEAYELVKNAFIQRLGKEKDVKKLEDAWLLCGDYLSKNANTIASYESELLPILSNPNSLIWNQNIADQIAFFKKIPDSFWGEDVQTRDGIVERILQEIENKRPEEREVLLFEFLKKDGRLVNSKLLVRAQNMWVKSVSDIMGKPDDESDEYLEKIRPYINKVKDVAKQRDKQEEKNAILGVDKEVILKSLADEVISQKRLSYEMKPVSFSFNTQSNWERDKASLGLTAAGAFDLYLGENPEKTFLLIDFLRSKGTDEDCRKIQTAFFPNYEQWKEKGKNNEVVSTFSLSRIRQQYEAFWSFTPDVQTLLFDSLLRGNISDTSSVSLWEKNFDYVADQVFGTSEKLKTAFKEYIRSREPYERHLALSRLLVASGIRTETTQEEENQKIGKGIKLFLESIGPAGIKLGQALSAVPDIPDYIRNNLSDFASNATRPARWEIYEWMETYAVQADEASKKEGVPAEKAIALAQEKDIINQMKFGKILGSASFFVTMDAGQNEVVKCLRLGAKVKAEQEMKYILDTLENINKLENSQEILGRLGPTLINIVKQASNSVKIETNLEDGNTQFQIAKELYPKTVAVGDYTFKIKEAEWLNYGEKWARLEKMDGIEIDKIENPAYRKAASMAYFSIELLNIFSGGKFDFDRHKGQMHINTTNNTFGLFDTGSMLLKDPTKEDQETLGKILYRTLECSLENDEGKSMPVILTQEVDAFFKETGQPNEYITQFQRGLLALSAYYKDLTPTDLIKCMDIAFNNPQVKVSENIVSGFTSEMVKKTGLFALPTTAQKETEEIAKNKEKQGKLIFNLISAAICSDSSASIAEVLADEYHLMKENTHIPFLRRFLSKKEENEPMDIYKNIKIPSCFGKYIVNFLKRENVEVDPIIVKGIMKEAFHSICLIDKDKRDNPRVKMHLGKRLYEIYASSEKNENVYETLLTEMKKLSSKSVMARNLYAVLSLSKKFQSHNSIDLKEITLDLLSQDDTDKFVLKGLKGAMKKDGQYWKAFALSFKKPITSAIKNVRTIFSLFKPDRYNTETLFTLLNQKGKAIAELPKMLNMQGEDLLIAGGGAVSVSFAEVNPSIIYKRSSEGDIGAPDAPPAILSQEDDCSLFIRAKAQHNQKR